MSGGFPIGTQTCAQMGKTQSNQRLATYLKNDFNRIGTTSGGPVRQTQAGPRLAHRQRRGIQQGLGTEAVTWQVRPQTWLDRQVQQELVTANHADEEPA